MHHQIKWIVCNPIFLLMICSWLWYAPNWLGLQGWWESSIAGDNVLLNGQAPCPLCCWVRHQVSLIGQARQCTPCNGQGQGRSGMMMLRYLDGRLDDLKSKIWCSTDMFWSLLWVYDYHWKIMSYSVVKNKKWHHLPPQTLMFAIKACMPLCC